MRNYICKLHAVEMLTLSIENPYLIVMIASDDNNRFGVRFPMVGVLHAEGIPLGRTLAELVEASVRPI